MDEKHWVFIDLAYIGILKRVLKQCIENENCLILSQSTYVMKRCFLKISWDWKEAVPVYVCTRSLQRVRRCEDKW
jgi:hypothetical protein